jgi:uncharacterized NAD(P)/FAD-binding protein YdhS
VAVDDDGGVVLAGVVPGAAASATGADQVVVATAHSPPTNTQNAATNAAGMTDLLPTIVPPTGPSGAINAIAPEDVMRTAASSKPVPPVVTS